MKEQSFVQLNDSIKEATVKLKNAKEVNERVKIVQDLYRYARILKEKFVDTIGYDVYYKLSPEEVVEFAENNEYPSMCLQTNVVKVLKGGKESWINELELRKLKEPYNSNYTDLVQSIIEFDVLDVKE